MRIVDRTRTVKQRPSPIGQARNISAKAHDDRRNIYPFDRMHMDWGDGESTFDPCAATDEFDDFPEQFIGRVDRAEHQFGSGEIRDHISFAPASDHPYITGGRPKLLIDGPIIASDVINYIQEFFYRRFS